MKIKLTIMAGILLAWPLTGLAQNTEYPIMHYTPEQKQQQALNYAIAPQMQPAFATPLGNPAPASMNLLPFLPWNSSNIPQRSEVNCGNCWQWASTAVLEAAHTIQSGVNDRISIQFLNSCNPAMACCAAGDFWDVTSFYGSQKYIVPWSNTNASFSSGNTGDCSAAPCGSIDTSIRYPIATMPGGITIATQGVGQAQAIANIENVLNHSNVVYFGFSMDTGADWTSLFNWWDDNNESAVWTDFYSGQTSDSGGGGHAVAVVGYSTDGTTNAATSYWVMLNSWGNAYGNRPNGLLHVAMYMNYNTVDDSGYYTLFFETVTNMVYAVAPPSVTSSPASRSNLVGTAASFAVTTSPGPPLTYQWRKNGTNLSNGGNVSGATSPTLSLTNLTTNDAASYAVVLTDLYGAVTNTASLVVEAPPVITALSATNLQVIQGNCTNLSVTATGTAPLSYFWHRNSLSFGAGTNSFQACQAASYFVVVSNIAGMATSAVINVTALIPPSITAQPQCQTNLTGDCATFSVAASGTTPMSYYWQYNNVPRGAGTNTLSGCRVGSYSVLVSNVAGVMMSDTATLTWSNLPPAAPGAFQSISRQPDGSVLLSMSGTAGSNYVLEYTSNWVKWSDLTNLSSSNGSFQFDDPSASNGGQRFYLLRTGP